MKASYGFLFNRRAKQLVAGETAPIHLEVYFQQGVRRYIDTHIEVEEKYWDERAKVVRKNHPNHATLYQHLRKLVDDLEEYELKLIAQGGELTPDHLSAYQTGSRDNFHEFAKSVIAEQLEHKRISQDTYDAYYSSIGLFEKALGQLRFCDINETLVKRLDLFLTKNEYEQTTIGKRHGTLKKFITAAEEKGLLDPRKNPYLNFEVVRGESDRANLEPSELHSLEGLDRKKLINAALEQVYDRFLYSCYTGLRIGDNGLLNKKDIKHTPDGLVVDMVTEKGKGKRIVHHLAHLFNGKPQIIIQKYLDKYPDQVEIFPKMSDQAINRQLKLLASIAGIEKDLTFHMARHTCGTALADISANPYLIMDILGHRDIKTSMIYIHSSSERIKKQLKVLHWDW